MIVIDRNIDLVSVMTTQFTYEGFIDELFSIEHSCIQVKVFKSFFQEPFAYFLDALISNFFYSQQILEGQIQTRSTPQ